MLQRSFYFLRHGETDWNKEGRVQGHTDIPLNDTGRSQAEQVVCILARTPIHRIVVSSLSRAYETASIVNAALQKPLAVDEGLKERHFGDFEGLKISEYDDLRGDLAKKGLPPEENGYPCPPTSRKRASRRRRMVIPVRPRANPMPTSACVRLRLFGGILNNSKEKTFSSLHTGVCIACCAAAFLPSWITAATCSRFILRNVNKTGR
jgi:hypothetical protein